MGKAQVSGDDVRFRNRFFVQRTQGGKVTDPQQIKEITTALGVLLKAKSALSAVSRPKFDSPQGDAGRMNALMGATLKNAHRMQHDRLHDMGVTQPSHPVPQIPT